VLAQSDAAERPMQDSRGGGFVARWATGAAG
jgi:hypothetical protein